LGDVHLVLTHDLTIGEIGVGDDTSGGLLVVLVEEVQLVDVSGGEFGGLDVESVEETTGLVDGGHEGGTDHGGSIGVDPLVPLDDGEELVDGESLVGGGVGDLDQIESLGAESQVEGLTHQTDHGGGVDGLQHGEEDVEEVEVGDGGEVVGGVI